MASYAPFLFAFLALWAHANAQNKPSVSLQACEKSLFKDLCVSTFASLPEAKAGDFVGLTSVALTTVTRQAVAIHAHIQLLSKRSVDVAVKGRLNDCAANYRSAIANLEDSVSALEKRNYPDVNTLVSAAMSEGTSCEDGIRPMRKSLPRLSPFNRKFNGLCSILLTFTNLCGAPKLGLVGN